MPALAGTWTPSDHVSDVDLSPEGLPARMCAGGSCFLTHGLKLGCSDDERKRGATSRRDYGLRIIDKNKTSPAQGWPRALHEVKR